MNTDGTNVVNLSNNNSVSDTSPQWSPDGTKLAFTSNGDVLIANLDGEIIGEFSPPNNITSNPSWSPQDDQIAINSTFNGSFEIYLMDYDGENLVQLTDEATKDNSCPTWSPNGELITFASHAEMSSGFALHLMNSDGSNISSPLYSWAGTSAECPLIDWSPDGKRIATISRNLLILEGSQFREIRTVMECATGYPDWSPDGNRIVFAADQCTNDLTQGEIFVIDVDGTNLQRLTNNSHGDYRPVWSPDGQQILFVSLRDGNREIYIMNSDGSEQINLTKNSAEDDRPVFQP
ncbi:hypothetical protein [Candidatus Leptofilum sp.]|uniref:hypothetical protein n=1 Tax=Candidatus Leptofilum sp. TaxID=3241576 RepID=UPI003B59A105